MKIAELLSASRQISEAPGFAYGLMDALPMAKEWLERYRKSGTKQDFAVFADWVHHFQDDPRLADVEPQFQGFQKDRDALKIMRGYLDLLASDYQGQQWNSLKYRYSLLLGMVGAVHYHVFSGWSPKADKDGKTIIIQLLDDDVLGIRWAGDRRWVEVRGSNYWKWTADDPLHQLIDRITGNISDLMVGREVAISPNYDEYAELKGLLAEHAPIHSGL